MSTATIDIEPIESDGETIEYRALHTGALIALVLGALSVSLWFTATNSLGYTFLIAPIPLVGMFLAFRAIGKIRMQPEQYTGSMLAIMGLTLSIFFLSTGVGYAWYVYATEVPDGYTRISFGMMKPDEIQLRGGVTVPPDIAALEGKNVFVKGFMRPSSVSVLRGIDRFLLVLDDNQCCFGDISKVKYYDQIDVTMKGDKRVDYSKGVYRMGGTLHIESQNAESGRNVFSLKADYAKD